MLTNKQISEELRKIDLKNDGKELPIGIMTEDGMVAIDDITFEQVDLNGMGFKSPMIIIKPHKTLKVTKQRDIFTDGEVKPNTGRFSSPAVSIKDSDEGTFYRKDVDVLVGIFEFMKTKGLLTPEDTFKKLDDMRSFDKLRVIKKIIADTLNPLNYDYDNNVVIDPRDGRRYTSGDDMYYAFINYQNWCIEYNHGALLK